MRRHKKYANFNFTHYILSLKNQFSIHICSFSHSIFTLRYLLCSFRADRVYFQIKKKQKKRNDRMYVELLYIPFARNIYIYLPFICYYTALLSELFSFVRSISLLSFNTNNKKYQIRKKNTRKEINTQQQQQQKT